MLTENRQDAFEVALAALRRKERTSAELDGWLRQRGFAGEEVDAALAGLTEAGELDDRRFALRYAQDKRELRGWGAERIREALAARKVPPELIEVALEAESRDAAVERASELLARPTRCRTADHVGTSHERRQSTQGNPHKSGFAAPIGAQDRVEFA